MDKNITISDVAKKAGVSIGTVHKALNGKPGVSQTLREKIIVISNEMGYKPNRIAASLRQKPMSIAVLFPVLTDQNRYFYGELWKGCKASWPIFDNANCSVVELPYMENEVGSLSRGIEHLLVSEPSSINGVMIGGKIDQGDLDFLNRLATGDWHMPIVAVGENFENLNCLCSVQSDHTCDGSMAAELLDSQLPKKKDILCYAGDAMLHSNMENSAAFTDYMKLQSPERKVISVFSADGDESVTQRIAGIMKDHQNIGGLYSVSARGTLYVVHAVEKLGLEKKVRIVGSDLYRESYQYLKDGVINNIIYKNPKHQAEVGIQRMINYLMWGNAPVVKNERLTSVILNRSNADKY